MTGRDLIIYILKNNLEDELVYKDGRFVGFITLEEAAVKLDTGIASTSLLKSRGSINGIAIPKETILIADDSKLELLSMVNSMNHI